MYKCSKTWFKRDIQETNIGPPQYQVFAINCNCGEIQKLG